MCPPQVFINAKPIPSTIHFPNEIIPSFEKFSLIGTSRKPFLIEYVPTPLVL